ncbi:hypothetical protein MIND_01399100 [Mycena indigotica]|uniref:Uncharacterized protein n=1 Tax=Mycena indigotica TaxID=2126181 RepID=A0A8H6VPJ4_9AGAR|nr:uncharacterized protein MIND_01399100 [Mycena indigotica]KAF7289367.1 hypothetical protein MIND_01399100 [Mycena indigotica]
MEESSSWWSWKERRSGSRRRASQHCQGVTRPSSANAEHHNAPTNRPAGAALALRLLDSQNSSTSLSLKLSSTTADIYQRRAAELETKILPDRVAYNREQRLGLERKGCSLDCGGRRWRARRTCCGPLDRSTQTP